MIHEELDHYEEFGEILGNHSKLWRLRVEQDVNKLSELDAYQRLRNLRTYVSRDGKKLKKMKAGPEKEEFRRKLQEFEFEKELLDKRFEK